MEKKMPHDKNGKLIEVGDTIITRPYNQHNYNKGEDRLFVGTVVDIHSQEQSCTGQIDFTTPNVDYKGGEDEGRFTDQRDYFGAEESVLLQKADGTIDEDFNAFVNPKTEAEDPCEDAAQGTC